MIERSLVLVSVVTGVSLNRLNDLNGLHGLNYTNVKSAGLTDDIFDRRPSLRKEALP